MAIPIPTVYYSTEEEERKKKAKASSHSERTRNFVEETSFDHQPLGSNKKQAILSLWSLWEFSVEF